MNKHKYYSKDYTLNSWFQYNMKYPYIGGEEYNFSYLFRFHQKPSKYLHILPNVLDEMIGMCNECRDPQFMPFIWVYFEDFYIPLPRLDFSTIDKVASYMIANDPCTGHPVATLKTPMSLPYLFALCDYCDDLEETWLKNKYRVIYRRRLNISMDHNQWYEHGIYIFPQYYEFTPIHKNIDWENIYPVSYWSDEKNYPDGWEEIVKKTNEYITKAERLKEENIQLRNEEYEKLRYHKRKKMRM
jgi:hypothetical protein